MKVVMNKYQLKIPWKFDLKEIERILNSHGWFIDVIAGGNRKDTFSRIRQDGIITFVDENWTVKISSFLDDPDLYFNWAQKILSEKIMGSVKIRGLIITE